MSRPGCYGVPSVYTPNSPNCKQCPFAAECALLSLRVLERMNDPELVATFVAMIEIERGIEDAPAPDFTQQRDCPVKRRSRASWTPSAQWHLRLQALPQNVAKIMRGVLRGEDEVIASIARGRNPFNEENQRSLMAAFGVFLRGPTTQEGLRMTFTEDLGWSKSSATVQACVIFRAFMELGITVPHGARGATINPDINDNTISLG